MLRNMIKGTIAFAIVGVLVSLTAPVLLEAIGFGELAGAISGPLVNGMSFGLFGFFVAPLQKCCDKVFGDPEKAAALKENAALKQHVMQLEGREQFVEHAVANQSVAVQQIVARGSRKGILNFSEAETARAAEAAQTPPTLQP